MKKTTKSSVPSLNPERLKEREESLQRGGKFNRLKDGKNVLRLFSFPHVVTADDYKRGVYKKGSPYAPKIGSTVSEIDRKRVSHFIDDGNKPCEGTGCPHCAEAAKIRDPKARRQASARQQFEVNAVDPGDLAAGVQIWTLPTSAYRDILAFANSGEYDVDALFGPAGRDFIIKRNKNKPPANMYEVMLRDATKCVKLDEDLQNQVVDLIAEATDHVGADDDEEPKKDDPEDEVKTVEDEDEDEDKNPAKPAKDNEDSDDAEDEDEKPTKKTITKAPIAKKAESEDEESETEDEAPKKPAKKPNEKAAKPTPKVGNKVTFVGEDGGEVKGTITGVEGDIFKVKDKSGDEWEMSADDFKLV